MSPERRRWWPARLDYGLLWATVAICLVSWLALLSATRWNGGDEAYRQAVYISLGWLLAAGLTALDPRRLAVLTPWLYLGSLGLLAAVLVPGVGQTANGSQRWIELGGVVFQPSELMKLVLVLVLARQLGLARHDPEEPFRPAARGGVFLTALVLTGVPFLLIAGQPDLGTALVLIAICLVMLFVAGGSVVYLAGLVTTGLGVLPYVLKEYQRDRLLVFMNPELDPRGMGYSLVQSKTAIGSGGVLGKGLFSGHLTQHGFVPENWTDFIFTVVGEEMGFFGTCGFLCLFVVLLGTMVRIAHRAGDGYGGLLVTGVFAMLAFQLFVNVAMTLGLAPVVGLPLPFSSYGGSAMLVNLASVGVVAGVAFHGRKDGR